MNKSNAFHAAKNGHPLVYEYDDNGEPHWAIGGSYIHPNTAIALIKELGLEPQNDCLFPEAKGQSYAVPRSPAVTAHST